MSRPSPTAGVSGPAGRRAGVLALLAAVLAAALLAAGPLAPPARADGDPASDYLLSENLFLPYFGNPQRSETNLSDLVARANRAGFGIRVAVIAHADDMGSIISLYRRPRTYARFLAEEIAFVYRGRLLVAMPNGFGFNWSRHPTGAEDALLAKVPIGRGNAGLLDATATAVTRLAAAAGVAIPATGSVSGGSDRPVLVTVLAVVAVVLAAAGTRLWWRRRGAAT